MVIKKSSISITCVSSISRITRHCEDKTVCKAFYDETISFGNDKKRPENMLLKFK